MAVHSRPRRSGGGCEARLSPLVTTAPCSRPVARPRPRYSHRSWRGPSLRPQLRSPRPHPARHLLPSAEPGWGAPTRFGAVRPPCRDRGRVVWGPGVRPVMRWLVGSTGGTCGLRLQGTGTRSVASNFSLSSWQLWKVVKGQLWGGASPELEV